MEFTRLIEERRSIRAYAEGTEITVSDVKQMIYAAEQAPSWKNSETGRYYAVLSKDAVAKVRDTCLPSFNRERTENAAALIVTTFKRGISGFTPDGAATDEHGNGWGAYDLGLQTQNLILKARDMGYDTLIMGLRREDKLREILSIPEDEALMAVIAVGKRSADVDKPRRKELDEIVKFF